MNILGSLQKLGRALMLPIATLPLAALLLRFGQPDLLNTPFIAEAGGAIFSSLPLLFATGIAVGLAQNDAGASGLAGVVGYLVLTKAAATIDSSVNLGVLGGIVAGIIAAQCYNRFHAIKLPEFLAFFGGKRFVPISTGITCLLFAIPFGYLWPYAQDGINAIGHWMVNNGPLGGFVYGTLNRLLIPTGLHLILNSFAFFVFGDYHGVAGDLHRFFAGDPTAGLFMTGFFPVMMFGLPAACLAMYTTAYPENRRKVAGLLFGVALTSFLTGVTEPVEFMFMFLAPVLYLIHAVLTGIAMALANILDIHLGFGFSAGAIDFILNANAPAAKHVDWLLLMGIAYGFIYFLLFVFAIRWLDLKTPGREERTESSQEGSTDESQDDDIRKLATQYLQALGGKSNLTDIDACITRLRLTLVDPEIVDEDRLKALGAKGVIRLGQNNLQVILGPLAELVCNKMKESGANPTTSHTSSLKPLA